MDIKATLESIYDRGGTRGEAMRACQLSTSQLTSWSTRLGLFWDWPLENRKNGTPPKERVAETIPLKRGSLIPSASFISARERRERGLLDREFSDNSFEAYLHSEYAKKYG